MQLVARHGGAAPLAAVLLCTLLTPAPAAAPCDTVTERVAGGTWTTRPVAGLAGGKLGWRLGVDERDPRLVVVADHRGVLVSRDGGCRWARSLVFADVEPPLTLMPEDVEVAGTGRERVVHVLVATGPDVGPRLLSSPDDGRSWEMSELPQGVAAGELDRMQLSAAPLDAAATYLMTVQSTGHGGVAAADATAREWRWKAVTAPEAPDDACVPGGPCLAPPLRSLQSDPRAASVVWGLTASGTGTGRRLVRSSDGGSTWTDLAAPGLIAGPTLMDVAGKTIVLLDDFRNYALSRDGGRSWTVGDVPELISSEAASGPSFDVAHAVPGRFGALVGLNATSPWSGNLLAFDGATWTNVSPPEFAGYARTDSDGDALTLTELTSARDALLVLSSRGELMSFRPRR